MVGISALLCSFACGGSDQTPKDPSVPDQGNNNPAGEIVGGELLGWDQVAPSVDAAQGYSYTLYVDGARQNALGGVRCEPGESAVGYRCSGILPPLPRGSRTLQLTSASSGGESGLSVGISVTVR